MRYEIRPRGPWTDPETNPRAGSGRFRATWDDTLALLGWETEHLGAGIVVVQIDVAEADLRRDGMLKSKARVRHPGVIVSFESTHGPLRYATDAYEARWSGDPPSWQANVRAIALALEALRAVDRYGVTKRGEQYRGWTALPAGRPGEFFADRKEALTWMLAALDLPYQDGVNTAELYKRLARTMHPDVPGGSKELWERLDQAATILGVRR